MNNKHYYGKVCAKHPQLLPSKLNSSKGNKYIED